MDDLFWKFFIFLASAAILVAVFSGNQQADGQVRLCHVDDVSVISEWRSNCHASGAYSLAECQRRAESLFCDSVDDI